ncbi:MAG: hypothetical protein ACYC9O_16420, partial [Candidatus Latescibacterota bacterium]
MLMRHKSILIYAAFALLFSGCTRNDGKSSDPLSPPVPGSGESGTIEFLISFAPWDSAVEKSAVQSALDRATAYVSDSAGKSIVEKNLEIADGRAKGSITVEARDSLRVAVAFFEGDTVCYLGEDPVVNVSPRGSTTAEILEYYMGTEVSAPDSASAGQSYTISWLSRPFTDWYELQESRKPDFSDSWTVYSGKDTTRVIDAKTKADALTTYYYRARVVTKYGPGPWHGTGKTGIAGDEGIIIIDFQLPPETPPGGSALTLTAPAGGEVFTAGSVQNITWKASGISKIKIEYSKDLGMTWLPLAASLDAATGTWPWTLPNESIPGCLVRIADASNPKTAVQTGLPFSIVIQADPQAILVTAPNGGETLAAETTREITWTSRGVNKLNVEFSRDGGKTWIGLGINIAAAAGKFSWNIPNLPSTDCVVRLRASADSLIADTSDQKFTITATVPSITVLSPNGGETFDGYSYIPVTWSSTGVSLVKIELSLDNGVTWKNIISANSPSWQVNRVEFYYRDPEFSTQCLFRVRNYSQTSPSDHSDRTFTLKEVIQ